MPLQDKLTRKIIPPCRFVCNTERWLIMEKIKFEVLRRMQGELSTEQLAKLKNVLDIVLYQGQEESTEIIEFDGFNENILRKFIATKRLEGISENSLDQYKRTALNLFDFIQKNICNITSNDIRYYLSFYEENRKVSKVTIDNMRRYLSSFFGWCSDEDIIEKNPMKRIKAIKFQKIIKDPFTDEEMEKIRCGCKTLRDRTLVEFLYSTGCRVSEVVSINLSSIDFVNKTIVVNGKGNKQREVYISEKAMYWLNKYIQSRKDTNNALFVGKRTNRLSKAGIEAALKKIGNYSSVSNVHPHRFRRTIATNLINKGMNIQDVKQILGHAKIETTMIYCKIDKNNVKAAHKKYVA